MEKIKEILDRPFESGSRVTNCVSHMHIDWHDRPKSCELCTIDMANTLNFAVSVNKFLNQKIDDAKAALTTIK